MKSVQLVARRTMELREMPMPPDPAPGEVLVKVRAVGICGSDMHWYSEGGVGPFPAVYPQVLGHEPAGEIVAAGKGVDLRLGQRVAIEPAITCGECEFCRSGRHNHCVRVVFMSTPAMPGLFREYALVPARNAVPVPERMTFGEATVIEPLAVILHVLELTDIRLGDTVAVMGAGPIGLLTASVARLCGASRVFVADKVPHRVRMAREMGVDLAVDVSSESMVDAVMDQTHGRGVDIVFDAAGKRDSIETGFRIARAGGRFVLIGIPSECNLPVDLHTAMAKELNIQTIKRSNCNDHGAIQLLEAGRIPKALITHTLPLEKTPDAFAMLAGYTDEVGKVVIEIS
jgi:L-iditol 2-dehydrogenase